MISERQLDEIRDYASGNPAIAAIYLFGSEAAGCARRGSDVDLAVVLSAPIGGFERVRMETELSQRIGRDVDLVVFHEATALLKHKVLEARQRIYEADRRERVRQETAARLEYWDTRWLHRTLGRSAHG